MKKKLTSRCSGLFLGVVVNATYTVLCFGCASSSVAAGQGQGVFLIEIMGPRRMPDDTAGYVPRLRMGERVTVRAWVYGATDTAVTITEFRVQVQAPRRRRERRGEVVTRRIVDIDPSMPVTSRDPAILEWYFEVTATNARRPGQYSIVLAVPELGQVGRGRFVVLPLDSVSQAGP